MHTLDWEDYLKPPTISAAEHKAISAASFAWQRENIKKLCHILHPHTVVCMGAGYLNDIPLETFIAENANIYLVEWIDGIAEQAFRHDLVKQADPRLACLVCQCTRDPRKYCRNYRQDVHWYSAFSRHARSGDHCDNFHRAKPDEFPLCGKFAPAAFPCFVRADVTAGMAEHFARQVGTILGRSRRPQQAFHEAIQCSTHPRADKPLPIDAHMADFITSSMVASQFDFEPFTFFVRNLQRHFGQEALDRNYDMIKALAATLRNNLLTAQVEAHCREIVRLLKPGGRVYFSIETLHRDPPDDFWFYAEMTCKVMEIVAKYFLFDLDTLPEIAILARTAMVEGGASVVYSYLLLPKLAAG